MNCPDASTVITTKTQRIKSEEYAIITTEKQFESDIAVALLSFY